MKSLVLKLFVLGCFICLSLIAILYQHKPDSITSPERLGSKLSQSGIALQDSTPSSREEPQHATEQVNEHQSEHTRSPTAEETDDLNVLLDMRHARERLMQMRQQVAADAGLPPPQYPYRLHLRPIEAYMETQGYTWKQLGEIFNEELLRYVVLDPFERDVPQSQQILRLSMTGDKASLQRWIAERLMQNPQDIPAFLVQKDLYSSERQFEEFFRTIQTLIHALESHDGPIDSRSILFHVIRHAETWGYATTSDIEEQIHSDGITLRSGYVLVALEEGGYF